MKNYIYFLIVFVFISCSQKGNKVRIVGGEVRLLSCEKKNDGSLLVKPFEKNDTILGIELKFFTELYYDSDLAVDCKGCDGPGDKIFYLGVAFKCDEYQTELSPFLVNSNDKNVLCFNDNIKPPKNISLIEGKEDCYEAFVYSDIKNFIEKYNRKHHQVQYDNLNKEIYFWLEQPDFSRLHEDFLNESCYIEIKIRLNGKVIEFSGK